MSQSELRVEKRRADAELTLSTGTRVKGAFFLAGSTAGHSGPERVGDLLNSEEGVFPFELAGGGAARTVLYNRAHIATVALPPEANEAQLEPGYDLAKKRRVSILLSSGMRVSGTVSVCRPVGRDRLSDYAHLELPFWYLETSDHALIINSAHIVELVEIAE
ncbi:MAG: hypothetical protein ABJC89_16870 [Acidobacteriota bacterium]